MTCPKGHPKPAHQHFCSECGAAIAPPRSHPAEPRLERWEERVQWPLAIVALIFLADISVEVLARPHGMGGSGGTLADGLEEFPYEPGEE